MLQTPGTSFVLEETNLSGHRTDTFEFQYNQISVAENSCSEKITSYLASAERVCEVLASSTVLALKFDASG